MSLERTNFLLALQSVLIYIFATAMDLLAVKNKSENRKPDLLLMLKEYGTFTFQIIFF